MMSDSTGIEWTDATWNPVTGCTKVSQGCKNCYAERVFPRAYAKTGRKFTDVELHPERLDRPLRWKEPKKIFVDSMTDLFHDDVPDDFIYDILAVCAAARHHTFQILTKRQDRMHEIMARDSASIFERFEILRIDSDHNAYDNELGHRWPTGYGQVVWPGWPLPNVWMGVSCEDQATADERIPVLIRTPAAVRFASIEPLLGPIDLDTIPRISHEHPYPKIYDVGDLDWVIVGGESGPNARPMHPDWPRSIRDQCQSAGVPFFFKQWGGWASCGQVIRSPEYANGSYFEAASGGRISTALLDRQPRRFKLVGGFVMERVGKKAAGSMLDDREWKEWPAVGER